MSEIEKKYREFRETIEPELAAKRWVEDEETTGCVLRHHRPGVKRRRLTAFRRVRKHSKYS